VKFVIFENEKNAKSRQFVSNFNLFLVPLTMHLASLTT